MIENIKNAIYQRLEELFALGAVDELTGDTDALTDKLKTIADVAGVLGVKTEISAVTINLKSEQ